MEVTARERPAKPSPIRAAALWMSLVDAAHAACMSPDEVQVRWPGGALTFPGLTPGLRSALLRLNGDGATEHDLLDRVVEEDGAASLGRLYYHLDQLAGRGALQYDVRDSDGAVARLRGMTPDFHYRPRRLDATAQLVTSRFALLRREGNGWIVESPLVPAELTGVSPVVPMIFALLSTQTALAELDGMVPGLEMSAILAVLQLMIASGAIDVVDDEGRIGEERSDALVQWGFHDLLFHSRSRFGRHDHPFGATFRHIDSFDPRPGMRPDRGGEPVELPAVDIGEVERRDISLTSAIETRVSTRRYGSPPITIEQLGEFLYRTARVRSRGEYQVPNGAPRTVPMEITSRPYPSGGASYELEIYLIVDECSGLERGMYHYHAGDHRLERIRPADELTERMLAFAGITAPGSRPQVLINIAARFQRVSWKYDAIAYATIQKHVGIVYQTMYLVATAMGLGGCALGSGDADLFVKAARANYYEETSVGDFMLGSLPTPDHGSPTATSTHLTHGSA